MKRLLCYESQHQSQSNEESLVQFDDEKAVSNYLGTQSTFKSEEFTRSSPKTALQPYSGFDGTWRGSPNGPNVFFLNHKTRQNCSRCEHGLDGSESRFRSEKFFAPHIRNLKKN